jgi:hypothetical protein
MNKEETLYPWTMSLVDNEGYLIDSTTIYAINRPNALKNAYRLLMFQGLSHMKRQLKLRKQYK